MANAFAQHFKQVYTPNPYIIEGLSEKHILESLYLNQRQSTSQTPNLQYSSRGKRIFRDPTMDKYFSSRMIIAIQTL